MTVRWKRITPFVIGATLLGVGLITYEHFTPELFSDVACVRTYPDGRVEKDWGDRCYDKTLPEAIVLKSERTQER